jgi:hypothetical protein
MCTALIELKFIVGAIVTRSADQMRIVWDKGGDSEFLENMTEILSILNHLLV